MRITIDIDTNTASGTPADASAQPAQDATGGTAEIAIPADLLARAIASNALSAGPAPDFSSAASTQDESSPRAERFAAPACSSTLAGEADGITNGGAAPAAP